MKTYELIILWETGEKTTHTYNDIETAERAENGYKKAFGNQISWTGINERLKGE